MPPKLQDLPASDAIGVEEASGDLSGDGDRHIGTDGGVGDGGIRKCLKSKPDGRLLGVTSNSSGALFFGKLCSSSPASEAVTYPTSCEKN